MTEEIQTICLSMPLNMGSVNCYLLKTAAGFVLIDTGMPSGRKTLENALLTAGCQPGNLALIAITHGDFDHIGSAAYLGQKYGSKIGMHPDDAGMAEQADMFWNRGKGNRVLRPLVPFVFGFRQKDRFSLDIPLREGLDLAQYGLQACVLEIPGHSRGSVGILTAAGDLFCGDLWMNDKNGPSLGFGDAADFAPSVTRLKAMEIRTIYPGHGDPFPISAVP